MDADTRHQLKQNELAEALTRLRDLRNPKFLASLAVLAVVVLALLGWFGWKYSQRLTMEQTSQRLGGLQDALNSTDGARIARAQEDLRGLIDSTGNADMAAAARLLLARSRYDQAMQDPAQRPAGFEEAATVLEKVRATPQISPVLQAAATYLMANAYESLRQIDRAEELWQSLARDPLYAGTPYQELAEGRLMSIDELRSAVAFLPGNPPAPEPPAASGLGDAGSSIKLVPGESILVTPDLPPVSVPNEPPMPPEEAPEPPAEGEPAAEAQPPAPPPAEPPPTTQPAP